jgi:hypothetical protein
VSDEQRRTEQARIREQVRELLEPATRIQEAFSPLLKDISNFIDQSREQILASALSPRSQMCQNATLSLGLLGDRFRGC